MYAWEMGFAGLLHPRFAAQHPAVLPGHLYDPHAVPSRPAGACCAGAMSADGFSLSEGGKCSLLSFFSSSAATQVCCLLLYAWPQPE